MISPILTILYQQWVYKCYYTNNIEAKYILDRPDEYKQMMSDLMSGRISPMKGRKQSEWDSALSASENLEINHSGIVQCCNSKQKTSGGFVWIYKNK